MTPYEILRLVVWLVGVPIIALLVVRAVRTVRAIRREHERLLKEEEATAVKDPYARLAEQHALLERARRGR